MSPTHTSLPMDELGKREARQLVATLAPGETVLGRCVGDAGQALVLTDRQVLVIKGGVAAGMPFGARVSSFDYENIVAAEVSCGLLRGVFQIRSGGTAAVQLRHLSNDVVHNSCMAPNGIPISRSHVSKFQQAAGFIRQRGVEIRQASGEFGIPRSSPLGDPTRRLLGLEELRAAGLISEDEFRRKRTDIVEEI